MEKSKFVGKVGDYGMWEVRISYVNEWNIGAYRTYVYLMNDREGNQFIWNSKKYQLPTGIDCVFVGRIVAHEEYVKVRHTRLGEVTSINIKA